MDVRDVAERQRLHGKRRNGQDGHVILLVGADNPRVDRSIIGELEQDPAGAFNDVKGRHH